ncbi:MAG: SMC family ATPase [Chloroflexi bacterium]|nr:SMC family ATPase [Chloroflexota bacterium]
MLIYSVRLSNFKSYAQAHVHFALGTNAIVGSNGAGKSSLLEAIGFALFDYVPTTRQGDLLREGASSGLVNVSFRSSQDDRRYEVERQFGRNGTTRHRIYDPENDKLVLAESVSEVRQWIHEHLGIDPETSLADLFSHTIGVPQGSFTAPFLLSAGERKRIFDPLLQVDEYERAYQNLRDTARHLQDRQSLLAQEVAHLEGLLAQLPALIEEEKDLAEGLAVLQETIALQKETLATHRREQDRLDKAERLLQEASQEHRAAEIQRQSAERDLAAAEGRVAEAVAAAKRLAEAEPGHVAYLAAEARRTDLEHERQAREIVARELEHLRLEQSKAQTRLEELTRAVEEVTQVARELAAIAPQAEEQRALQKASEEARVEARQLPEARRQAERLQREIDGYLADLAQIEAALAEAPAMEAKANALDSRLQALDRKERELLAARSDLEATLSHLREQVSALETAEGAQCPTCEADLAPERRASLLARDQEQLVAGSTRMNEALAALRSLGTQREDARRQKAECETQLRSLPATSHRDRLSSSLEERRTELAAQESRIAAAQAAADQVEALTGRLAHLGDPVSRALVLQSRVAEETRIRDQMAEFAGQEERLSQQIAGTQESLRKYDDLDAALTEATAALNRSRHDHEVFLSSQEMAGQLVSQRDALEQSEQRLADCAERVHELADERDRAQAGYDQAEHQRVRDEAEAAHTELVRASTLLSSRQSRLSVVRSQLQKLQGDQERLAERQAEGERLSRLSAMLEELRSLLRLAGPHVTRHLVANISAQASSYYCDIMGDYTGQLDWSEDYDLSLKVKGRSRAFQQLSGGEQMTAALALRLALLRHLSNVNVAFFDEPTAHLDPERRDGLAEQITQVKGFDQLFVISHDDTFERAAQNYIRVIKEDGESQVEEGAGAC